MSQRGKTAEARKQSHMVIGPWEHGVSQVTGDVDFGPDAQVEREVFELPWFDYWLKGIDNGVGSEPPVSLFVMGKNIWRQENEYPLARTRIPQDVSFERRPREHERGRWGLVLGRAGRESAARSLRLRSRASRAQHRRQ